MSRAGANVSDVQLLCVCVCVYVYVLTCMIVGVEKVPELAVRSVESIVKACPVLAQDRSCWCIRPGNVLEGMHSVHCTLQHT